MGFVCIYMKHYSELFISHRPRSSTDIQILIDTEIAIIIHDHALLNKKIQFILAAEEHVVRNIIFTGKQARK